MNDNPERGSNEGGCEGRSLPIAGADEPHCVALPVGQDGSTRISVLAPVSPSASPHRERVTHAIVGCGEIAFDHLTDGSDNDDEDEDDDVCLAEGCDELVDLDGYDGLCASCADRAFLHECPEWDIDEGPVSESS